MESLSQKCCCKVINNGTKKTRICKGSVYIILNNKKYCWIHAKKSFGKFIVLIQKVYRSMIARKKIKNIYYNLPEDIKKLILFYVRIDIYYIKYKKICQSIIQKKINYIDNILNQIGQNFNLILIDDNIKEEQFIIYLLNIYNLFINNWNIINFEYINDDNLIKLYILACCNIWGTTTWNGIGLSNIINTIYIENYNLYNNFVNLLRTFKKLWEKKFIYFRENLYNPIIRIR